MQVPREDATQVAAADHLREPRLVLEFEHPHRLEHGRRDGRVVDGEQRAVHSGRGKHIGEPVELVLGDLTVVVAGHGRVERDDAKSVHVVDAVLWRLGFLAEQDARVLGPLVVVAHHPDELGAHPLGGGLDEGFETLVRVRLTQVGKVAREDEGLRMDVRLLELMERLLEVRELLDESVELAPFREQMGVADVSDDVRGCGVLAELDHASRLLARHAAPPPLSLHDESVELEPGQGGCRRGDRETGTLRDLLEPATRP